GGQLVAQLISAAVLCTVMFGIAYAFFKIQNAVTEGGIRPSAEDELQGLDMPEMGVLAYPEFTGGALELELETLEAAETSTTKAST
ncbi:MAG: ammonium transporter, partial [Actinobacteria bacterium]|nr:ammonium transporter [Actinomycetota bacterium]